MNYPRQALVVLTVTAIVFSTTKNVQPQTVADFPGTFVKASVITDNCNKDGVPPNKGVCQPKDSPGQDNGGAGPNPDKIAASVEMCESGGTLTVRGSGSGFRFGGTYISLIYFNPNTNTCARFPDNVPPTLANATNPLSGVDNDFASMMLGVWTVLPDGSAFLNVTKQKTLTGLGNYGSVSVREVQPINRDFVNVNNDPAPQLNALRACGRLEKGVSETGVFEGCGFTIEIPDVCAIMQRIDPTTVCITKTP